MHGAAVKNTDRGGANCNTFSTPVSRNGVAGLSTRRFGGSSAWGGYYSREVPRLVLAKVVL